MVQNTVSSKLTRKSLDLKHHLNSETCVKLCREDTRLFQPTGDMFGACTYTYTYQIQGILFNE